MAKLKHYVAAYEHEKEFLKLFNELTYCRTGWQVWEDLMTAMACCICMAIDRTPERFDRRKSQFERAIENLGGPNKPDQMFEIVVDALEQNPDQDFLGKLYMNLNLGSHWHGQFFTPYNVCRMMAEMNFGEGAKTEIKAKGYISICDPCVGAGAMLIAAANAMKRTGVNYQLDGLFVGQDVDRVVAMMAYIQISLIGCPGYIIVGNSLTNPPTFHPLFPKDSEGLDVWITPFFMRDVWEMRKTCHIMRNLLGGIQQKTKTLSKDNFYFFFNFDETEVSSYGR